MKSNVFPALIAIMLAALLGLLAATLCRSTDNALAIGVTTGLSLAITLVPCMALKHENSRVQVNIRVLCTAFTFVFLIVAGIMCFITVQNIVPYLIIVGIIALIFLSILHTLTKIKDV